jgi:murein DD-endopeptidase MepM/ murein hydrolase activator NlpD
VLILLYIKGGIYMKKYVLLIIIGIGIFTLSVYAGIRLIKENMPDEGKKNDDNVVKVNVIEKELEPQDKKESIEYETEVIKVEAPYVFSLVYPVEGEIGLEFSPNNLIYSKTLQEWTVHNGVDIDAKRGTPVKASESGIIENITETADKGIEIVISHENGYKTIYSNLPSKDIVRVGEEVLKGQVISGVGNTSAFEYYEPDHLHFEIKKDGKYINPLDVLR